MKDKSNFHQVRLSLLTTLYASLGIVYIGGVAATTMWLINFLTVNDGWLAAALSMIVIVALLRIALTLVYRACQPQIGGLSEMRFWENMYLVGAVATLGGFGIVAATSVIRHPEHVMSFIAVVTSFAATLSVGTRNYSSAKVVNCASLACCLPVFMASVWNASADGSVVYWGVAATPPFVATMSMYLGRYLRAQHTKTVQMARSAALNGRKATMNAQRFDLALTAMPAGLVLIGAQGNLGVVNNQAAEMLGLEKGYRGSFDAAITGTFGPAEIAQLHRAVDKVSCLPADDQRNARLLLPTLDGRWFQCGVSAIAQHGGAAEDEDGNDERAVVIFQEATDRVASDEALRKAACYDKLTGIPNRQHWETLVGEAISSMAEGEHVALCILDVDRFKLINDTMGHHVGDEVIAGVASRLASSCGGRLICGRMGGDEFVVLATGMRSPRDATAVFDEVFDNISRPYVIGGNVIDVKCSGGVIVRGRGEFILQEDLNRADTCLYKIKKNPDRCWMLFDAELEDEYQATSRIKHDLKAAISKGTLEVRYQPIFDVAGATMVSAEALCRWEHYEAGFISPTQFIAMAEEIGVIGRLTEYVLRTACRDCKAWGADVAVSVNLSALDLARDDIVGMIDTALRDFDLPSSKLCIEVTETVFVKDFAKTAATLRKLRMMGVKTSLDDFGTGYSSLSYLNQLPLNRVKIDRAFVVDIVSDPVAQRLFRGVVGLAKELEFEIIVEGVEAQDQLDYIRKVPGVDMIQGYIFSDALTVAEMKTGGAGRPSKARAAAAGKLKLVESR
jgi:diguanylate cyclase (GGDEF)-like protein